jgi:hypothetical protein
MTCHAEQSDHEAHDADAGNEEGNNEAHANGHVHTQAVSSASNSIVVALSGLRLGGIDCLEPLKLAFQVRNANL